MSRLKKNNSKASHLNCKVCHSFGWVSGWSHFEEMGGAGLFLGALLSQPLIFSCINRVFFNWIRPKKFWVSEFTYCLALFGPNSRRLLGVARNFARFSCHPCTLATSKIMIVVSLVTDKKRRIFRSLPNADKKMFIFNMLIKNCFQTSTTSTLLATAEPAMTTTVAFAGASLAFDHQHGDDRDDCHELGDMSPHLICISTKTHLQWDIERKRRRRGNYYMAPPQHCRPPPLGESFIIMIRICRRDRPHKLYMAFSPKNGRQQRLSACELMAAVL